MSAFTIDPKLFDPSSISPETEAFQRTVSDRLALTPKWYTIGAAETRRRRAAGEGGRPVAIQLPTATDSFIPSREAGRNIPLRVLNPQNGKEVKGVFMYIHAGGWVLGTHTAFDTQLQAMADEHGLVGVSVGYRLAPEDPFPAGPEDCYDAVEWLVLNAKSEYGAPLAFIGGESAGAHLSLLCVLHLLQHVKPEFSDFAFRGVMFHYGVFTLNFTPSVINYKSDLNVILDYPNCIKLREAFLPNAADKDFESPLISPLYADYESLRGRLPPALFTVGTKDCLLDDTLFMSAKWMAAGGKTVIDVVPGAQHGYMGVPRTVVGAGSDRAFKLVDKFIEDTI